MALVHKFSNVIVGDIVLPSVHYYVIKNVFFQNEKSEEIEVQK